MKVDELEEAEFIQDYLKNKGKLYTIEDILLITDAQIEYLKSIGLVVENK
ncbi:hypothetical protein [Paenibacillus cremeus]|nr:hypothetical protein [Paenibacillus cremeus]